MFVWTVNGIMAAVVGAIILTACLVMLAVYAVIKIQDALLMRARRKHHKATREVGKIRLEDIHSRKDDRAK